MTSHHAATARARILIIGIGNTDRGDDAAGLLVARRLRLCLRRACVLESNGDGLALMDTWRGTSAVVVIDAVQSGAAPGTIHRLDAHKQPVPATWLCCSTHDLGVAEAVELSRTLGHLPPHFTIYGIEGGIFKTGAPLSAPVARSIEHVEELVLHEIRQLRRQHRTAAATPPSR